MIGKWSLPQESSCTLQLYSIKVAGSIAENVPEDELRWVWAFRLWRHRLLLMIFSRVLPLLFVVLLPHKMLWLLKSPINIYGLGSWFIKLFSCSSFIGSWGGMYIEQMAVVLCKVAEIATAGGCWCWFCFGECFSLLGLIHHPKLLVPCHVYSHIAHNFSCLFYHCFFWMFLGDI